MPQPDALKRKQALARIQRLCCLGLGGEILMPHLMQEIMGLIPSHQAVFLWLGADLEIANAYTTIPASYVEILRSEFYAKRREWEYFRPPKELMNAAEPNNVQRFEQILHADHQTFLRSDYYNLIFRPLGIYEPLGLRVRDGGRNYGILYNFATDGTPFGSGDVSMLGSIAGFIAHGMTRVTMREADALTDSNDRALFIVNRGGAILHASPQARQLLIVALNPRRAPRSAEIAWRSLREPVPEIAHLCRALAATVVGEIGQAPPVQRMPTPFGEFVFRAYWLEPTDGAEMTRHIGITIERRVPRALAVFRRVESFDLTAREKQLCLLLARDLPLRDLADAMGLAAGTVVSHQRSVYAKLGVHSRVELLAAFTQG